MENLDIAIIGAGVVGLAIAVELAVHTDKTIVVIEKNRKYGQEVSSRNSEVIHSGIYYPADMLKSQLCIEGNHLLYDYCHLKRVSHRRCGKLVISTDRCDEEHLDQLYTQVKLKGIQVSRLMKQDVAKIEPEIHTHSALLFPDSGTIDVHGLMQALYYEGREAGVYYLFDSEVRGTTFTGSSYKLETQKEVIQAEIVINSAGLGSEQAAAMLGIDPLQNRYHLHLSKGEYFKIKGRFSIDRLIYPLPGPHSLGIHLSHDAQGSLRLGPNAHYVDDIDYSVDENHQTEFFLAASQYISNLRMEDLSPDFAGIRPKLQAPGEEMRDFVITEETEKGFPGWINLIGIESPGLTSCLAIARYVRQLI